jgi:hypothetical protein
MQLVEPCRTIKSRCRCGKKKIGIGNRESNQSVSQFQNSDDDTKSLYRPGSPFFVEESCPRTVAAARQTTNHERE